MNLDIFSPVDGVVHNLQEVPDLAFSDNMVGDGVAVLPSSSRFHSPVNGGVLEVIFETNHAFSLSVNDIGILVHIGVDTIELNGEPFKVVTDKEGGSVSTDDAIIEVDLELLKEKKLPSLLSPVLLANFDDYNIVQKVEPGQSVKQGDLLFSVVE